MSKRSPRRFLSGDPASKMSLLNRLIRSRTLTAAMFEPA